ncbi:hypothetical protein [Diaphorobacter ruginosibacter]|uniref:hypothetical protein n=1 Tax=Diaphorobacter ruginosibacter TaxID=1715720 RepID=UPI00333FDDC0
MENDTPVPQPEEPHMHLPETGAAARRPARARSGWSSRFRSWMESAGQALERAEKRITDNFRVPPNGG